MWSNRGYFGVGLVLLAACVRVGGPEQKSVAERVEEQQRRDANRVVTESAPEEHPDPPAAVGEPNANSPEYETGARPPADAQGAGAYARACREHSAELEVAIRAERAANQRDEAARIEWRKATCTRGLVDRALAADRVVLNVDTGEISAPPVHMTDEIYLCPKDAAPPPKHVTDDGARLLLKRWAWCKTFEPRRM